MGERDGRAEQRLHPADATAERERSSGTPSGYRPARDLQVGGLGLVGHTAIRVRGTVGGSIAHADPAAELPALLACYDGVVVTRGRRGERSIAAAEFFLGPLMTALAADELLVETRWPVPTPGTGWGLHEVARRHGDFALVGAAALVTLSDGKVARARVAVFGCGATPTHCPTS